MTTTTTPDLEAVFAAAERAVELAEQLDAAEQARRSAVAEASVLRRELEQARNAAGTSTSEAARIEAELKAERDALAAKVAEAEAQATAGAREAAQAITKAEADRKAVEAERDRLSSRIAAKARKAERWTMAWIAVCAALAGVLSFAATTEMVERTDAVSPGLAWMVPFVIEGTVIGLLAGLTNGTIARKQRALAWAAVAFAGGVGLWANFAHAGDSVTGKLLGTAPTIMVTVVAKVLAGRLGKHED